MSESPTQEANEALAGENGEEHRAFVREMNDKFSVVYGYGGAAVMAVAGSVLLIGWNLGLLWTPLIWILAVTAFLVGLFVLRLFVRRRAKRLADQVRQYCEINEITVDQLRERWGDQHRYPYFTAIFEVIERRRQLKE